ncbi:MAG: alpha-amylase family glycosyl hydrolase, partial [Saprospiraceae bacterium]
INPGITYQLNSSCTTSGAMFVNVADTNHKYVFKTSQANSNPEGRFVYFKVEGTVQTVTKVLQSPTYQSVTSAAPVIITAISSGDLPLGQGIYLRYTTNQWSSSTIIPMTGIEGRYLGEIPQQTVGTNVSYYIFTSGAGLTISHADADFYTINSNTNLGSNFNYSVVSTPKVIVTPPYPNDGQSVIISFDATGTALAGASKVYLHSGLSSTATSPASFGHTIGHWGLDDGIGKMTSTGTNTWSITLSPSLRTVYNIPTTRDIFGLNFLFRNADGTLKEDNGGANFFNAVDPGSYFTITDPANSINLLPVNQPYTHKAAANSVAVSWQLDEIDPISDNFVAAVQSFGSVQTINHTLTLTSPITKKFRLSATFAGSITKQKTFTLQGFNPVTIMPRPSNVRLGVNYHANDSTKATLVLHAPTFTNFLSGLGQITGTNPTTPKKVVYVVGDFNGWSPHEDYKMFRDTGTVAQKGDYWWIELNNLIPGQEYVFQYLIDGDVQVADPYTHKVSDLDDGQINPDVYPNLIQYRVQASDRASVLQTQQQTYIWKASTFNKPTPDKLNIYEMHFRDFTEEGTYLAAIDRLDYIQGLGVNAIHVMPVSEFEGNTSWGYNPNFYFAADKAYGTPQDLKRFIDECHKRKIQVFNDLVLNHAFYSNVMARMYWNESLTRPADDNPWFNPEHKMVRNPAGHWGADWNHESEHTQAMVDSILGHWLKEFNFDGFRFDFTKGFGQTDPNDFPFGDDWASATNQARIELLKRMVSRMWSNYPDSVAIFEHLANSSEDKVLADFGILMWSGVGHHNDIKRFILGYDADDPNIYDSGVYDATGRDFNLANWMSYGESHDEERLAYEVKNYFNWAGYSGPKANASDSLAAIVDRLKIGAAFNFLLRGPRMIWQFQELGYDYSINYNGRVGEKPVRWDYLDNTKRKELYTLISRILKIRNKNNIYGTTVDYGNIGLGANNIAQPRVMRLSAPDDKHVIVVANLDPAASHDVIPLFDVTGTWYRYNGNIDESPYEVTSMNQNGTYLLQRSETMVFTNFKIDDCTD